MRLAVDHPDYRYPPSKNIYAGKNAALTGRVFSDNETESRRGRWREAFPERLRDSELHLEVGCNAGHVVVEWAKLNPSRAYIGLDWKFKAIHRGAEKAIKRGIENLIFFRAHAIRLKFMFGDGELDSISLFFPDPWPKKAHWKHRYVNSQQLRDLHSVLKSGGLLHIKTDHPGYFEWMKKALEETRDLWDVTLCSEDFHATHPNPKALQIPDVTLFEKLFVADEIPIHALKLLKR